LTRGLKGRYQLFISSLTVPSVLGPLDGDALGFVLPHEHLTIDIPAHVAALFESLAPPDLYYRLGVTTPRRLLCWDRSGRKLGDDGDPR